MFLPHKVSDFLALCSTFRNLGTPVQIQSLDWLGGGSRSLTRRRWTWKEKSRRSLISEPSFNPKQEMGLLLIHVTTLSFHCYDEDYARQSKATILKSLRPFETRIYFQISILRSKMRIHGIIIFFFYDRTHRILRGDNLWRWSCKDIEMSSTICHINGLGQLWTPSPRHVHRGWSTN